jgi:hypothetical protein
VRRCDSDKVSRTVDQCWREQRSNAEPGARALRLRTRLMTHEIKTREVPIATNSGK